MTTVLELAVLGADSRSRVADARWGAVNTEAVKTKCPSGELSPEWRTVVTHGRWRPSARASSRNHLQIDAHWESRQETGARIRKADDLPLVGATAHSKWHQTK